MGGTERPRCECRKIAMICWGFYSAEFCSHSRYAAALRLTDQMQRFSIRRFGLDGWLGGM
jgi:hypothetical protein